ncbi:MAG: hypothetical protein K0R21_2091, partial [Anaerocolumna sp.]|nr:hypothetical protein [Anaerocolumna sp.]
MQIKHLPSGLFPHFDSGFERRPLYPKCGESVIIGCRLNGPTKKINILLHWKSGSELMPVMECQDARCNDIEQWYYTFTIQLPDSLSTIEYWFTATDESESVVSQVYQFETLQEIVLSEPSKTLCQDNKVYAIYHTEKASYELKVEVNQNISIFFTSYLTVKVVDFQEFDEISY